MVEVNTKGYVPSVAFQVTTKEFSEGTVNAVNLSSSVLAMFAVTVEWLDILKKNATNFMDIHLVILARRNLSLQLLLFLKAFLQMLSPSANMTSTQTLDLSPVQGSPQLSSTMTKKQIQEVIFFFGSKLISHGSSPSISLNQAPSTFVPSSSQLSGTFLTFYPPTFYDMLTSKTSEMDISPDSWVIDSGATHHVSNPQDRFLSYQPLVNTLLTFLMVLLLV